MKESGWMDQDRGGVYDSHQGSKDLNAPPPINITKQREGEKETDDGKDNWGEGLFLTGSYIEA